MSDMNRRSFSISSVNRWASINGSLLPYVFSKNALKSAGEIGNGEASCSYSLSIVLTMFSKFGVSSTGDDLCFFNLCGSFLLSTSILCAGGGISVLEGAFLRVSVLCRSSVETEDRLGDLARLFAGSL